MAETITARTLQEKRALAQKLLQQKRQASREAQKHATQDYERLTYDMFMHDGPDLAEITRFNEWIDAAHRDAVFPFENPRRTGQFTEVELVREQGEVLRAVNLSSYNYLGLGYHPEVLEAARVALMRYGLGASSSPVISGTLQVHKDLEQSLVRFFGLPNRGVSLFTAGYSVNIGAIQAYIKPGNHVVMDAAAHMSIQEGARTSGGEIHHFRHNDPEHLEATLKEIGRGQRILVCVEGVYSADGDVPPLDEIVKVSKRHGAAVLVDEAHSMLLAGPTGRGIVEEFGVLDDVDMLVMTFSKAFGGVGGALYAPKSVSQYVNWYAKCRMFSCALDPAVTGGMVKVIELAAGPEGDLRRRRIRENADYLRESLRPNLVIGSSTTWIVPVLYGDETMTLRLNDFLQREGLDTSIISFPAVAKGEARIRMFVTSEHTREQLDRAVAILLRAADKFGFPRP